MKIIRLINLTFLNMYSTVRGGKGGGGFQSDQHVPYKPQLQPELTAVIKDKGELLAGFFLPKDSCLRRYGRKREGFICHACSKGG